MRRSPAPLPHGGCRHNQPVSQQPPAIPRTIAGLIGLARIAGLFWLSGILFAGPARASETIELKIADRGVAIDLYRPAAPARALRGAAILSHGFTRSRRTLGGHASALAASGVLALTPDMPYTFDFRRNAQGLAELVAWLRAGHGSGGVPIERVVLVGFSAGALSSLLAAGGPGVVGYIGLDAFDRVTGEGALGLDFAPRLATEAVLLRAPPSRCNAQSVSAPWGPALPRLLSDRVIDSASHCDFESPSDWICHLACGPADADRQAEVRSTLLEAVDRWLPPAAATAPPARP
jgi:hypothetical protein